TCILNSGGYFVNLLPFLAMRKEPPYKNSIVLFILSIIRGSFHRFGAFLFYQESSTVKGLEKTTKNN
ncbi:hypothetical protein, partial [Streptococcus sp. S784/96/1]|uniref:hypothetical protein n=1 Tax=Streptococcus sp. S784/96/1 TaxID=2653499 RepID=UPI001EE437BE